GRIERRACRTDGKMQCPRAVALSEGCRKISLRSSGPNGVVETTAFNGIGLESDQRRDRMQSPPRLHRTAEVAAFRNHLGDAPHLTGADIDDGRRPGSEQLRREF